MSTISQSFTAVGAGPALSVQHLASFSYSVSGTFSGTVVLEKSVNGGESWDNLLTFTGAASSTLLVENKNSSTALFRFLCTAYTSGTIVTSVADIDITTKYVESVISTLTNWPTSAAWGNLTSIQLPPGTWDATALIDGVQNGATITQASGGSYVAISQNSGTTTSDHVIGSNEISYPVPTGTADRYAMIPNYRLVLTAPLTTIYFKILATYSVAIPQFRGRLSAKKVEG